MSNPRTLRSFLIEHADRLKPVDPEWPDGRSYLADLNDDALSEAWLEKGTSYIWKVGVLAQWDLNKCDHAYLFIGHEREPSQFQFIGMLEWTGGENDDIGRCLERYLTAASRLHPVFEGDRT